MNLRFLASCSFVCAALLLSGCDSGRQPPGRVTVQVVNAAPGFEQLAFRREQSNSTETALPFKDSRSFVYDADTYDFYVTEPTYAIEDRGRVWTFEPKLEENTHYTFVLTEVAGEIQPVVIPYPDLPTGSNAQVLALHAASGLPAMDLYLQAPGVGIAGATPRGTFGAQQQMTPITLPGGDYELFLTVAGNPADVLLTSSAFNLPAGTTSTLVVLDERGGSTSPVSTLLLGGAPVVLPDRNATSELRAINGANDRAPRDVALNSQFSPPLFPATTFGEPTPYAQVLIGANQVNVTPVGNPGVLELDTQMTGFIGQRATLLFNGPAGTLAPLFALDDGRRYNREAKIRFMNVATQFIAVDFVVTFPDGDPNLQNASSTLFPPGADSYGVLHPGDYDLYLRNAASGVNLYGPTRFTAVAGGIYGVLAVDGADTTTADALFFDDFP
jgi:hypothetical protein